MTSGTTVEPDDGTARYNPLFERLVDADDDRITGFVAYALYKQKKRDWLTDFKARNGRPPSTALLDEYTRAEELPRNLESLRREARAILDEYAAEIIEAEYERLRARATEDALVARVEQTLRTIEKQGSFGRQLMASAVSTLASVVVLIVLAAALAMFGIDVLEGASKLKPFLGGS